MTFRRTTLALLLALAAALLAAPSASAYVYWSSGTGAIGRASEDGSQLDATFIATTHGARSVTVAGRTIYWVSDTGGIGRASLDGGEVEENWLALAHAVALTADAEHLYWTVDGGGIARVGLDGFRLDLIAGAEAVDVAVDGDRLYWADAAHGTIGRVGLDGEGAEPAWAAVGGSPRSLAVADGALFWADPTADAIFRMPLAGPLPSGSWTSAADVDQLAAYGGRIHWGGAGGVVGRARTGEPISEAVPAWLSTTAATLTGLAVDGRPGRPTVYGAASPALVSVGTAVTPSITVGGGIAPTGSATISLYADSACAGTPLYSETVAVNGAGRYATAPYTPARSGSYYLRTTYSGDAGNLPAEWHCGLERLGVSKIAEGMVVSVHGDPRVGRPLHATVAWGPWTCVPSAAARSASGWGCVGGRGRAAVAKGGTVSFALYGPDDPACRAAPRFTSVVAAADTGAQSEPFTPDAVGTWRWAASYSGDDANLAFATDCDERTGSRAMTIAQAAPRLTVAGPEEAVVGAPLRVSATLADAFEPGGELTFALHGPDDEQCAGEPLFTGSAAVADGPDAERVVDGPAFAPTAPGRYRWVVSYGGDARNGAAASGCGAAVELRAPTVDPPPPPPVDDPPPPPPPPAAEGPAPSLPPAAPPARPALARFALAHRCVRPAADGRAVAIPLRLWTRRAVAPRVRIERALGTGGRDRCPPAGSPGRFAGRLRTVAVVRPALGASASAAGDDGLRLRSVTVRLRLAPALYRVTVTVDGHAKRRWLRVLAPRG